MIRRVNSLRVNGTRLLAGTRGEGRLYRATNLTNWSAWSESGSGFTIAGDVTDVLEVADPTGGGFLLATNQVGVSRTPSDAPGWRQNNQGLINTEINDVIVVGDTVYAGAAGGRVRVARNGYRVAHTQGRPAGQYHRERHSQTPGPALLRHQQRRLLPTRRGHHLDTVHGRTLAGRPILP
jgi:hypothetical protein